MKRLALAVAFTAIAAAVPGGVAVAASPSLRTALVHTLRGCHVWAIGGKPRGPSPTVTVARGTRMAIRITCPMDFELTKTRGPGLALGALAWPSALATARVLLALSGVLSIAVPIANGLGTGAWFWASAARGHWVVFSIDACFLIAGVLLTLLAWRGVEIRH